MWDQQGRASCVKVNVSVCLCKGRMISYESNTPKVIACGVHFNNSGVSIFEQIVLPVSSSNLVDGNRAARVQVRNYDRAEVEGTNYS